MASRTSFVLTFFPKAAAPRLLSRKVSQFASSRSHCIMFSALRATQTDVKWTTKPTPSEPALQVKLLSETAKAPTRGSAASAGLDLYASEDNTVPPRGKALVKTGLQMRIPTGCYGRVAPRSGLALKKFIDVGAGVIDADYNGEVGVVLFNFSDDKLVVKTGDRIAQLILERICMAPVVVVDAIDDTQRGSGGFGSTGTN